MTSKSVESVFLLIIAAAFFYLGWLMAHSTVATECDRLGGFYVGDTTYRCVAIEDKSAG